jgi:hypothetical protein
MKLSLLFILISFHFVFGQKTRHEKELDTLKYVLYDDENGVKKKARVAQPSQVLIIDGDKMFFILDESKMTEYLTEHQTFDVIHNEDSVRNFLKEHVKVLVFIKPKKD